LLEILQSLDLVLMIHGEMPDVFVIEREREFLPVLDRICHDFPRLRVVLEHATTRDALGLLDECPNLAVSLTYHHLVNTLDDVVGDKLQPHNFCKPIPKTPFDREALLRAALSANPRVFLGSDSAPHSIPNKESCGCAGCFTAPFLVERLVDLFDRCGALTQLANFASCNARSFYRLPSPTFELTVEKSPTFIPAVTVDGVKNFAAGSTLNWTLL
jgi:dihydroorotase